NCLEKHFINVVQKSVAFSNFEEAYQSIFWYIEAFYNSKRIHQSLGYLTPNQFEKVSA
ncbi:IS3 family transposase, partial [Streptococcus iniae]|uniref:IS3 family transposase n=1 Tax=Streptococcus iniae TaxID=1346 RepID=UPI000F16A379